MNRLVKLVTHTENPEEILKMAYGQCYQKPAKIETIVKHLKHSSVLEHVNYTFEIHCSRVALEQFVRHRIASYTVQSHRYTEIKPDDTHIFIPSEIFELPDELVKEFINDCVSTYNNYKKWVDRGVKKETARYLINKGVGIRFNVTMNLRALLNFFELRTDKHAQEEIRLIAQHMKEVVLETLPNLKEYL